MRVLIVGAGPIGLEVAANLKAHRVDYDHVEAGRLGETIARWPDTTPFFSSPERVAVAGVPVQTVHQSMVTGEEYLAYLRSVVEVRDLDISFHTRVTGLDRLERGFRVRITNRAGTREVDYDAVILATGNMHDFRRLGVPGEELPHVHHGYEDVHRYFRQNLVVVGGKNSAVEAAIRAWRAGARVTLVHRGPNLDKAKVNSRYHLEISILIEKGQVRFLPSTRVTAVGSTQVDVEGPDGPRSLPADFVLLAIGFDKDLTLLERAGVRFDEEGRPSLDPNTMETNVPGLYLAGTAAGGGVASYKIFVGTSHHHAANICRALTGGEAAHLGTVPSRRYPFSNQDIEPVEGKAGTP